VATQIVQSPAARVSTSQKVRGSVLPLRATAGNECYALDAGTGRQNWHYQRPRTRGLTGGGAGGVNRGAAYANGKVFLNTDNAHLIALDRADGSLL
jgi:alcohol dehydrogenase (cytochrome c)